MRRTLEIYAFHRDKDYKPPVDEEDWYLWLWEHGLLTEKEAIREIAHHRRNAPRVPRRPSSKA